MVQYNTIRLLREMMSYGAERVQTVVLAHAGTLDRVVEVLQDKRELIRNG